MTCHLCEGTRHVWNEGRGMWVPCECLRGKRSHARYRRAGVPERFDGETWRTFLDSYAVRNARGIVEAAKILSRGEQPVLWILVHGRPTRARSLAVALLLRSACDGRLEARTVDVPSLLDAEFSPGRGVEVYGMDVLAIEVGGEPAGKWTKHVVEKAVRDRWARGQFTVFVTESPPSRLPTFYKSGPLEEALAERFVKVRVSLKEGS